MKRYYQILQTCLLFGLLSHAATALPPHGLTETSRSTHFIFHCDPVDAQYAKELIRFSEGFLDTIRDHYFRPGFQYPLRALIFVSKDDFDRYLRERLHITNPPGFGIYLTQYRVFATFRGSGLGTFAHEIMHPLVAANLPDMPVWAEEGFPAFFEKFIGYWEDDKMYVQFGYQNPWRLRALGPDLRQLDLREIVTRKVLDYGKYRNSELRMVSVFLDKHDLLESYIKLVHARRKGTFDTYLEAAFRKPMKDIEPLWQAYLDEVIRNSFQISRTPASRIFDSKSEFEKQAKGLYR